MILALASLGCEIMVTPIPQKNTGKYHKQKTSSKPSRTPTPAPTTSRKTQYEEVSADWLESYKKKEREYNYPLLDDRKIQRDSTGGYLVPKTVIEHYGDLERTEIVTPPQLQPPQPTPPP
jgi:hypothetical protein